MSADVLTVGKNQYKLVGTQNVKNNPNSWINKEIYLIQSYEDKPVIASGYISKIEKTFGKIEAIYFEEDERTDMNLGSKAQEEIKVYIQIINCGYDIEFKMDEMYFFIEDLDKGYLYTLIKEKKNGMKDKLKMEIL